MFNNIGNINWDIMMNREKIKSTQSCISPSWSYKGVDKVQVTVRTFRGT